MGYKLIVKPSAVRDLESLDADIRKRILKKLTWFISQNNPLSFARHLTNSDMGEYRFRIGDWRIVFDVSNETIIIVVIDKRDTIYK